MSANVLLVDDETQLLKSLGRALEAEGYDVTTCSSPRRSLELLAAEPFDLLVVDHRMPELSGVELIRELVQSTPAAERPQILMMTAHATIENAIEAIKLGAFDYLQKPFDVEELLVVIRRAIEHRRLESAHHYLLSERKQDFGNYGIVGESSVVRDLIEKIERVARSRSTVLILGETGTGKELVARAIHDRSAESELPLIKVNCAAIPETLLESELFGHVKGAFTNAISNKKGKFSLAHGSTIFLDEIGMMSFSLQAKLLRVLQEREFEPLGSERTEEVDVRVIAATNRDLPRMIQEVAFQQDLYYRLSVIPLELPPLRERREDVPLLAAHFIQKHSERMGRVVDGFSDEALSALRSYPWPGNVRELENVVERAVVLSASSRIEASEISLPSTGAPNSPGLPSEKLHDNVAWAERESIVQALRKASGVKKRAAEALGISQRALSYYLKKYPLDRRPPDAQG